MVSLADAVGRSGALAAWGSAWLGGDADLDTALRHIVAPGHEHTVTGLPGDAAPAPLGWALAHLEALGACRLRLTLPGPGAAVAASDFGRAALLAGEGVVAVGAGYGLTPQVSTHGTAQEGRVVTVRWQVHPLSDLRFVPVATGQARADLAEATRQAAEALVSLEVARPVPGLAPDLHRLRAAAARPGSGTDLPPGYSARAEDLLAGALRIQAVVELARRDAGAAPDRHAMHGRDEQLRRLSAAARQAAVAAHDAYRAETWAAVRDAPAPRRVASSHEDGPGRG